MSEESAQAEGQTTKLVGEAAQARENVGDPSPGSAQPDVAAPLSPPHAFDREFDRLNDVLSNHSPQAFRPRRIDAPSDGKELQGWMSQVDKTLNRLRKRRAKRGDAGR